MLPENQTYLVYFRLPNQEKAEVGSVSIDLGLGCDIHGEIARAVKEKYGEEAELLASMSGDGIEQAPVQAAD